MYVSLKPISSSDLSPSRVVAVENLSRYRDIYNYKPLLRMHGATRKRSRPAGSGIRIPVSPAEAAFSACIGSGSSRSNFPCVQGGYN